MEEVVEYTDAIEAGAMSTTMMARFFRRVNTYMSSTKQELQQLKTANQQMKKTHELNREVLQSITKVFIDCTKYAEIALSKADVDVCQVAE